MHRALTRRQGRARQVAAPAASVGVFRRDRARRRRARERRDRARSHAADGEFLATAAWSPTSQIRARVWSFDAREAIDDAFFAGRVRAAVAARDADARRRAHRLPAGARRIRRTARRRSPTATARSWSCSCSPPAPSAWRDGSSPRWSRRPAARRLRALRCRRARARRPAAAHRRASAARCRDRVTHARGRPLLSRRRRRTARRPASISTSATTAGASARSRPGRDVLNCFCYTGGFTVAALAGGAQSVLSIDSSADALALARGEHRAQRARRRRAPNGATPTCSPNCASCATAARDVRPDRARSAEVRADRAHMPKRRRARTRTSTCSALKLLRPGGLLATFSCSGGISAELFQKIVAGAALDAARRRGDRRTLAPARRSSRWRSNFPEGDYLKGSCCVAQEGANARGSVALTAQRGAAQAGRRRCRRCSRPRYGLACVDQAGSS